MEEQMKYKIFNEGNTDQYIPISHGKKAVGVVGSSGNLPDRLVIPGKAKSEEGKNCKIVEEDILREIFGLFEQVKPGVIDPNKPASIMPKNVKRNSRLLDSGRIIVVDERGNHVFGIGGVAYQKNALDSLKDENQMLKEQADNLIKVLVSDGYTEEQAAAIVNNKGKNVQEILAKKDSKVTGKGSDIKEPGSDTGEKDTKPKSKKTTKKDSDKGE
jgi:hypothetical protein